MCRSFRSPVSRNVIECIALDCTCFYNCVSHNRLSLVDNLGPLLCPTNHRLFTDLCSVSARLPSQTATQEAYHVMVSCAIYFIFSGNQLTHIPAKSELFPVRDLSSPSSSSSSSLLLFFVPSSVLPSLFVAHFPFSLSPSI